MRRIGAAAVMLALAMAFVQPALLAQEGAGGVLAALAMENGDETASPADAAENKGRKASPADAAGNGRRKASPSDAAETERPGEKTATPSTSGKKNEVTNQEELIRALKEGEGDTIVLLSDIVWEGDVWVAASRTVTVLMGDYNLTVPFNTCAGFAGPVTFHGNGGGRPLICADGFIGMYNGARIEAEGEETTALKLGDDSEWELQEPVITARGRRAAAIEYDGTAELELMTVCVRAWGEESVGIRCREPLVLKMCSVEAEGEAVSGDGPVTVDSSRVSPMPSRASVIERNAFSTDRLEENGVCFEAGSSVSVLEELKIYYGGLTYSLRSPQTDDSYYLIAVAVWSDLPADLSEPGTHYATLTPRVPEWLPVKLSAQKVPIHIVDKNKPFLARARERGNCVELIYFSAIENPGELLLEYSTDGGDSWHPASDMERSYAGPNEGLVGPIDTRWDHWFRLTVTGGPMEGVSNVLMYRPGLGSPETGGDRDHDDRDDQEEDPPHGEIIPPPDDGPKEGGPENGGMENGGTENGGTENGGTENGETENGGTENDGTENSGPEEGGLENGSTENGGNEGETSNPTPEEEENAGSSGGTAGGHGPDIGWIGKTDGKGLGVMGGYDEQMPGKTSPGETDRAEENGEEKEDKGAGGTGPVKMSGSEPELNRTQISEAAPDGPEFREDTETEAENKRTGAPDEEAKNNRIFTEKNVIQEKDVIQEEDVIQEKDDMVQTGPGGDGDVTASGRGILFPLWLPVIAALMGGGALIVFRIYRKRQKKGLE